MLLEVDYAKLSSKQINFVEDLIHAAIPEIVRSDDVQNMIDYGVFQHIHSYFDMQKDVTKLIPHICTERCKICTGKKE